MSSYTWNYSAIAQLAEDQRNLARELPDIADEAVYEWGQDTRAYLKGRGYPSQPAPKKGRKAYRRTGRLANSWRAERVGRVSVIIGNRASGRSGLYPSYVIGDDSGHQAYMHVGRWWIANEEIESKFPELDQKMDEKLSKRLE